MLSTQELSILYSDWRQRYAERDSRMGELYDIVTGDFSQFDPDGEQVESRSPNLIQVALEDTAEAAALMPTIRVTPPKGTDESKNTAAKMERVGVSYMETSHMDLVIPDTIMDLVGAGLGCYVVWPDSREKAPFIEKRDPRTCYPEPSLRPYEQPKRVFFARSVYYSQLPDNWKQLMADWVDDTALRRDGNVPVTLVEYFDEHETIIAGMFASRSHTSGQMGGTDYVPVELERWENETGICPVIVGSRFTLDGEHRGQFDQVIGAFEAHVRLMGMILDYSDQAVYSDIWVRDLIGELPYGGGAYIELGPNGAIGRVPPAVTSFSVQQDLAALTDAIHMGGRWPKSRPGDVDQSIASAKFVEATAGVMNTVIKSLHLIMRNMLERTLRVCYVTDQTFFPGEKVASGILRNHEFLEEYDPATDIDLKAKVRVEYGLGFGRDPAQSAVLHIQYGQSGYISKETVQENITGIIDVHRENARIDSERLRDMLFAKLLQGVETGEVPDDALLEIMESRQRGDDLADIYQKYVVDPRQERESQMLQTGLGGEPAMAGAPAPGPPGGEGGIAPPGAPNPAELLSRVNIPIEPGGQIGSQVRGGGS